MENQDKGFSIGAFHKSFYVNKEDIPVIVLQPDQLRYLINDEDLESSLSDKLKRVKDIFVFGCSVALRVSDLLSLTSENLLSSNGNYYLNVKAKKSGATTSIKLPDYCRSIIDKYENQYPTLLPSISDVKLNIYLKELARHCNWIDPNIKKRSKRGKESVIFKDEKQRPHEFADLITSHTMRKTAITTMLRLGMPERIVKEISGHSPNSTAFYKYVEISQNDIDKYLDLTSKKLRKIV